MDMLRSADCIKWSRELCASFSEDVCKTGVYNLHKPYIKLGFVYAISSMYDADAEQASVLSL